MAPISKRRKLSDLKASGDTNELLNKIEKFISLLDEGREDLPDGLIDKLQELRDKLENVRLNNAELFTELISLSLAHFLLEGGSNNACFIGDIVWSTSSDQRQEARNRRFLVSRSIQGL